MKFVTLGPKGTCHEYALHHYLQYHQIPNAEIIYITNFLEGLELIYSDQADFLLQCSAHPEVHLITEKYFETVKILDTFIYPTKELVILENKEVENPRTLGLVKAAEGYLDGLVYPEIIYEPSKPVVGKGLLDGKYDAGLTQISYYEENKNRFRIRRYIGAILTTWLVYSKSSTFSGDIMSVLPAGFYNN
ncbi:hypothetical protein [Paenibacillus sp. sgz500958]|uniref:hypothetical protein n=1 Tax=Paenibacillus sp. sgz500958 TaxID=3242475 RepID=UPI0036D419E8